MSELFNYKLALPSMAPVAAGKRASVQLPKGPTYHAIILKHTDDGSAANEATTKANLTNIRLKINGTVRWELSATRVIDLLNKYYGYAFKDGYLYIPLARQYFDSPSETDFLAWGTKNVRTIQLEVDIDGDATDPTLDAEAVVVPVERDLGGIVECFENAQSTATTGNMEISDLPRIGQLLGLHIGNTDMDSLEVKLNQVDVANGDLNALQHLYEWEGERDPQNTSYYHFEPCYKNRLANALPIRSAQDFRLKLNVTTAGSFPVITEQLTNPLAPSAQ